ncbi:hypothetical protein BDV10DRAFT_188767 [Aspergillus recurvatus]
MALVRDPFFWQRFSRAVHLDEEVRFPTEEKEQSENWLASQQRKRRKSALWGCVICLAVAVFVAAVAIVVWWFCKHNWLQGAV